MIGSSVNKIGSFINDPILFTEIKYYAKLI